MHTSRDGVAAALQHAFGAGANKLVQIASETLRDAGYPDDPKVLAYNLGIPIRADTDPTAPQAYIDGYIHRVELASGIVLEGPLVRFRASRHETPRDWGLNLYLGIAIVKLEQPTFPRICELAGYLAMPEAASSNEHVPEWFVVEHRRRRMVGSASSVIRLVAK
jgi:hypothetical protein